MSIIKKTKDILDKLLLAFGLISMVLMVLVIVYQVFSREILHFTPAWTETFSKLAFVYVGFLGIAYGFKHYSHIALTIFVNKMPKWFQDICDYISIILTLFLGGIMLYYGWNFTVLMSSTKLTGFNVPTSVLYVIMPLTGFFVLLNGIELFVKKIKHLELSDEPEQKG